MTSTDRGLSGTRSVLILGGTSDIGVAIAEALVREQPGPVVIAARDASRVGPVAERLRVAGATDAHFVQFDGGDVERAAPAVEHAVELVGTIDVAIVAFGVYATSEDLLDDLPAALRVIEINLMGGIAAGEALSAQLRRQGSGTIIAVSSTCLEWLPGIIKVYAASKIGFDTYYRGLGGELAAVGAGVLVVRPPGTNTSLIEHDESFLEPWEVGDAVAVALAQGRTDLTIPTRGEVEFRRRLESRSLPRKIGDRLVHELKRLRRRLR